MWGVRGSLPTPVQPEVFLWRMEQALTQYEKLRETGANISARSFLDTLPAHITLGYGGNTMCGEVVYGEDRLLIDGGSGIRNFSENILRNSPTVSEFHIYMTHYHWDHLIGLPFFSPLFIPGKTVHFYSVDPELDRSLATLFKKPNFPVPFEVIAKQVRTHIVKPRVPFQIGQIKVTPYQLDHPDPCWGARIEAGGKSLAWAVDNEGIRHSAEQLGADLPLFTGADLMVFDAQYTFDEALEKINWGHSSAPIGIDLALRESIKRVVFVHHDPSASDQHIRQAEEQTEVYYKDQIKQLRRAGKEPNHLIWHFGREGEVFNL